MDVLKRGHVIRMCKEPLGPLRSYRTRCPSCKHLFDSDAYRKCIFLCCVFEKCYQCVLNKILLPCETPADPFWLPIIYIESVKRPAPISRKSIEQERGPSRLRNGKIFSTN